MRAPADVGRLRAASGLVVLTADTYATLQSLPVGGGEAALPVVRDEITAAIEALGRARDDLAAATRASGGTARTEPDGDDAAVVAQALPTVRATGDVVGLALTLEDVLAQTLVRDAVDLVEPATRVTVLGHGNAAAARKSLLLVVASLLAAGRGTLVAAPPDLLALPAGAGGAGLPDVLFPTDKASPATEGAR